MSLKGVIWKQETKISFFPLKDCIQLINCVDKVKQYFSRKGRMERKDGRKRREEGKGRSKKEGGENG